MFLSGSGATGKSRVINAIVETFRQLQCPEKLFVCVTTGVAANLIRGITVDSLLKLRRRRGRYKESDEIEQESGSSNYAQVAENAWLTRDFLILNEVSMLGCAKLTRISKALQKNKSSSLSFGRVHILFRGDICLYRTPSSRKDSEEVKMGMHLWSEVVKTTVLLTEHYRAANPEVHEVVERLRHGTLLPSDIERMKSRVFGHPDGLDPHNMKWQNAPLITPRNTIRQAWNNQAAIRYSIHADGQVLISPSIDERVQCDRNTIIWTADHKTEMLANWNVLCIGAVAVVTANIVVELNIANGSKVIIKGSDPSSRGPKRMASNLHQSHLSRPPITISVEPVSTLPYKAFNYHPQNHPKLVSNYAA
jgi:PIF1-like helicase